MKANILYCSELILLQTLDYTDEIMEIQNVDKSTTPIPVTTNTPLKLKPMKEEIQQIAEIPTSLKPEGTILIGYSWQSDFTLKVFKKCTFLTKIQNRINKKSEKEILLLSKFFGHVIKNLDGSGFSHPSFWSCDQKLGW